MDSSGYSILGDCHDYSGVCSMGMGSQKTLLFKKRGYSLLGKGGAMVRHNIRETGQLGFIGPYVKKIIIIIKI